MTARVSDYRDSLYFRDYSHDAPPQTDLVKRVAMAAVPFLSLHPVCRYPISTAMGTLRLWNADNRFEQALAAVVLVTTFLQHRAGMVITTIHDIITELNKLLNTDQVAEATSCLVKLLNHLFYLTVILHGGLEIAIISFAIQAVVNLIQSMDEFKNGRWIEGASNLLMACVRLQQAQTQYQQLKRNWEIQAAIKRFSVGMLHEKWRFPSDHLPVGIEVNGVKIISWNVLNNAYMDWVTEKDSQGLNGSMISELNVVIHENGLTMRDVAVASMVQNMMSQGHVVALQECSEPFLEHLQSKLPSHWNMVRSFNTAQKDQDVVLYNKTALTHQSDLSEVSHSAYPSTPGRPIQNVYFSNSDGRDLRVINAHIPGDPNLPARDEFARYVHQFQRDDSITIALGDNNFERNEMIAAYQRAGFRDFSIHSPWKTNIDPVTKESKGIDHLFVFGETTSRDLSPDEVLTSDNLRETINLLNDPQALPVAH